MRRNDGARLTAVGRLGARCVVSLALVLAGTAGAAPVAPRTPVRPPDAARAQGPVERALHRLLVGTPVRVQALAFVPVHARTPGEARRIGAAAPAWEPAEARVTHPVAGMLRLKPAGKRPVLVVPGRAWTVGSRHFRSVEGALCAPVRAGFLRVVDAPTGSRGPSAWIGAGATAMLLLDPAGAASAPLIRATDLEGRERGRASERATRPLAASAGGTAVGCVVLLAGEPVVTWIFGDAPTWTEARRDLVALAVAAWDARETAGYPTALLRQRAARADPRGRALTLLRSLADAPGRTREIPGGGLRWRSGPARDAQVSRALMDARGRLVFLGAWRVPSSRGVRPVEPPAPDADGDENAKERRARRARFGVGRTPRLPLPGAGG